MTFACWPYHKMMHLPTLPLGSQFSYCRNGGTCWAQNCCCSDGYEGDLCEAEILECESNPCGDGGTCIDYLGYYVCLCPEGMDSSILSLCPNIYIFCNSNSVKAECADRCYFLGPTKC